MAYLGKRDRMDESLSCGPPQKRSGFGGQQHQVHGHYQGQGQGDGRPLYENYPPHYPQSSPGQRGMPPVPESRPGSILLFTVLNPKYLISVDVMNTICTNNGARVNKIVILHKNGVQAMVEFETPQMAESIKESLNGADIYSGCCTLKIEWAKVSRLTVSKNDQDNWDFTSQKQEKFLSLLPIPSGNDDYLEDNRQAPSMDTLSQQPLHFHHHQQSPDFGHPPAYTDHHSLTERPKGSYRDGRMDSGYGGSLDCGYGTGDGMGGGPHRGGNRHPLPHPRGGVDNSGSPGPRQEFLPPAYEHHGGNHYIGENESFRGRGGGRRGYMGFFQGQGHGGGAGGGPRPAYPPMMCEGHGRAGMTDAFVGEFDDAPGAPTLQQGSAMMVYGLDAERMNCLRVFNLFCLYGNIVRVKFLKSKDGVAMVQMGDYMSCKRAANALNGTFLCGKKILIGCSKQAFIQDDVNPQDLPDGTPSFQDFMGNRNNRFTTPKAAAKNRINSSSKVLYFFNAPPSVKDEDLVKVFLDHGLKGPKKIKIFPTKTEKSTSGLLEWDNKNDSVEALVICNHTPMANPAGKNPYILKFCFSDVQIKNTSTNNNGPGASFNYKSGKGGSYSAGNVKNERGGSGNNSSNDNK